MERTVYSYIKKFLLKLVLLLVALALFDLCIGKALNHLYFKRENEITYVFDKVKAEVLVFGSSRASHQYVPDIFEQKFNESFYNCGHNQYYLIYHLAAISAVLNRYTPKRIILDIHPNEFATSEENSLAMLLPYGSNPVVKPFIKYNSPFENWKQISQIYPYNSLVGEIILRSFKPPKPAEEGEVKGYVPFRYTLPNQPRTKYKQEAIIPLRVAVLDSFLNKINRRNIPVALVISPMYHSFEKRDSTVSILEGFSKKYKNVQFFNYENDPRFTSYRLFQDERHLNDGGARIFSKDLAKRLLN